MNTTSKKILFLFPELAGYILSCMKELAAEPGMEVHVVRWPVNAIAPFEFRLDDAENLFFYDRNDLNDHALMDLVAKLDPDIIFCSGWMDKGYVAVCRAYHGKVKTVVTFDNPWRGTLKQHIAALGGSFYLRNKFSHCWVCGSPQKKYALKLGFSERNIRDGFYSCDYNNFHDFYEQNRSKKAQQFPKRFLFVGRYTRLKGAQELWDAFIDFVSDERYKEWELWCLGKGELEDRFPDHPSIKDHGFVQPDEINSIIKDTGIFILPSHYEHWGVVVHEFAAAGMPLLCTTTTGAATTFLDEGVNGYFLEPASRSSIVEGFRKMASLTSDELMKMGDASARIAERITPQKWVSMIKEFLNDDV
jgi:glycosyltransferase involved in cell wall biosynthesis